MQYLFREPHTGAAKTLPRTDQVRCLTVLARVFVPLARPYLKPGNTGSSDRTAIKRHATVQLCLQCNKLSLAAIIRLLYQVFFKIYSVLPVCTT